MFGVGVRDVPRTAGVILAVPLWIASPLLCSGIGWAATTTASLSIAPSESVEVVDPALFRLENVIGAFISQLGTTGLHTVDVDGDELDEIFVGHNRMLYMLAWDPESSGYLQRWYFDECYANGTETEVERIVVGPIGSGPKKVAVATEDAALTYLDAATGEFLTSHPIPSTASGYDLAIADLDPGPGLELLVLGTSSLSAYRYGNPTPLWSMPTVSGRALAVGQMDTDPGLEIAVAGFGQPGVVVDAATQSIQWSYGPGFGSLIDAGDLDGDGLDEVAIVNNWTSCEAFDVDTQTQKWYVSQWDTSSIRVDDITGDGIDEVIVGDRQWGDVHAHDGKTGARFWEIANPGAGVYGIAVSDVNGDCSLDLLWGSGATVSGRDWLFVADVSRATIDWQNIEADGSWQCFGVGDVDADGMTEFLRITSDSGSGGPLLYVLDLHHRREEYVSPAPFNDSWHPTNGMALGQLDADPALEYVIHDGDIYDRDVSGFDGLTHAREWTQLNLGLTTALGIADPDQDGYPEAMVGVNEAVLYQLDGATGSVEWQVSLGGPVMGVRVFDIDGDGTQEIIAAALFDGLYVFDGSTHATEWSNPLYDVRCLEVGDVDADGDPDIVAGETGGVVTAWDGPSKAVVFSEAVSSGAVRSMRIDDVDGDGRAELVFAETDTFDGSLNVWDISSASVAWTRPLDDRIGFYDSLFVGDADDDGKKEFIVSTRFSTYVFEYQTPAPDLTAPDWNGPVGMTSVTGPPASSCCPALDLAWGQATDDRNPPVTYQIYRDTDPAFLPSPATFLHAVQTQSYRDTALLAGAVYYYIVRASDEVGNVDNNTVRASGTADGVEISPSVLPTGVVGAAYLVTLLGSGGTAPYSFSLSAGALPPGLSLHSSGVVFGTPTQSGTYPFVVRVVDATGCKSTRPYSIDVACIQLTVGPQSLPHGRVGTLYSQAISASGGQPPYTFAVTAGALPPGITLAATGTLSGVPTDAGWFRFTITSTGSSGCTGAREYLMGVNQACAAPDAQLYYGVAGALGGASVEMGCVQSGDSITPVPSEPLEAWTVFNPTSVSNNSVKLEKIATPPGAIVILFRGSE